MLFLIPTLVAIEADTLKEAEVVASDIRDTLNDTRQLDPRVRGVRYDEGEDARVILSWSSAQHDVPESIHDGVRVVHVETVEVDE